MRVVFPVKAIFCGFAVCCVAAPEAFAQSADIPLQLSQGSQGVQLLINVGIGGARPRPYLFDTGSSVFNVAYSEKFFGTVPSQQSDLPMVVPYGYASGQTYFGNLVDAPSLTFYPSASANPSSGITLNATNASGGASNFVINAFYSRQLTVDVGEDTSNHVIAPPNNLSSFLPIGKATSVPSSTGFYGVFGAGDFTSVVTGQIAMKSATATVSGVPGQITIPGTVDGYVVAANGQALSALNTGTLPVNAGATANGPQTGQTVTSCSPCVMVGLTPALLAQFRPVNTSSYTATGSFPNSNAPSAPTYGISMNYSITSDGVTQTVSNVPTLLDTGTGTYEFNSESFNANSTIGSDASVTISGTKGGASQTVDAIHAAPTDPVSPSSPYEAAISNASNKTILGVGFFLQNSVLYDLQDQVVGYTPNFVTDTNIVTTAASPLTIGADSVPLGLAGNISGDGGLAITAGGSATLSGANTYTGATTIMGAPTINGTLALAGPGTIATSSGVTITSRGVFDISAVTGAATIRSLSGDDSASVVLGNQRLILSDAAGSYAGAITGNGGLTLAGGTETLTGTADYSGATAIKGGTLALAGTGALTHSSSIIDDATFSIARLTNGGTSIVTLAGNGAVALGANTLTIATGSTSFSGTIRGAGGLAVAGGTQTLSGVNSYTGATTIAGGTLALTGTGSVATSSGVADAGTFDISGTTSGASIRTLSGAGTVALGAQTLTLTNASTSFGGTIAGTGGLTITGGTQTLAGAGIYTGSTTIAAGATLSGLPTSFGSGPIVDAGTLVVTAAANASFANSLSGAGTFTQAGAGMLTLTGNNAGFTGQTIVNDRSALSVASNAALGAPTAGVTLNNGTTLDFAASFTYTHPTTLNGDPTFDVASGDTIVDSAAISGAGALVKTDTGTLDLTGANTLTGPTTVAGGTLLVDGSLAGSAVTVGNGAMLGGTGTIGGLVAQGGSTIAPGLATHFSTLTVAGNVGFAAGSTYDVRINAAGQTDTIKASGAATLSGGTVSVVDDTPPTPGARYTILTAASVSGTFSSVTTSDLALLDPRLLYDPADVVLTFASKGVSFGSIGVTRNQAAAGTAIQSLGFGNALYNAVLPQSTAGTRAAFDATSGEIHASAVSALVEDTRFAQEAIFNRLDDAARQSGQPVTAPFEALQPVPPTSARGYAAVTNGTPVAVATAPAYAAWASAFGDFGTVKGSGNAATLDRSMGGVVGGVDTRLAGTALDAWRVGLAVGYTNDTIAVHARGSSGTVESFYGGLYAGALYGPLDIKLGALGGGTYSTLDRTVAFPGFNETDHSKYGGTIVQGFGELGYRFGSLGGFLEPVAQGAAIHIDQNGFQERGLAAALNGAGRGYDVETATLGVKGEWTPSLNLPLIARGFVGWRHAFGDVQPTVLETFAAGGSAFTVAGTPIDRDAIVAQAGFDYRITTAATLGIDYSGQYGARATDNAVKGRFEVQF